MSGPQTLGASTSVAGVATLGVTGSNKVLFITGACMLVLGVATFFIAKIVAAKN